MPALYARVSVAKRGGADDVILELDGERIRAMRDVTLQPLADGTWGSLIIPGTYGNNGPTANATTTDTDVSKPGRNIRWNSSGIPRFTSRHARPGV